MPTDSSKKNAATKGEQAGSAATGKRGTTKKEPTKKVTGKSLTGRPVKAAPAAVRAATSLRRSPVRAAEDITTMRVRRGTLAKLDEHRKELGAASLDEALETILFRQRSYEAILRLKADPLALADYQSEAREWAEADVEVHE
jgi:hypothetical protein